MRLPGPLRAAVAVALVLAGCDYWDNLVDKKQVASAEVRVHVVDGWRHSALPDAGCTDAQRGNHYLTGPDGDFTLSGAPTGRYSFNCSALYYFDTTFQFDAAEGPSTATIPLVRKGGKESWYPDSGLRVSLPPLPASLIFPRHLSWKATPGADKRFFRYEWSFASNPKLGRGLSDPHPAPDYESTLEADAGDKTKAGPDTVVLKVYAYFDQHAPYLVGTDTANIQWVPNKLPGLNVIRAENTASVRSGCTDPTWLPGTRTRLKFTVSDPDGNCMRVRMHAADPGTAYGSIDTSFACGYRLPVELPLLDPFNGKSRSDTSFTFTSRLIVSAEDSNGQSSDTALELISYTNRDPLCTMGLVDQHATYFVGDRVPVWIKGSDTDGPITELQVNWGDYDPGSDSAHTAPLTSLKPDTDGVSLFFKETSHIYRRSGNFEILGYANDNCPSTSQAAPIRVNIRENMRPVIEITPKLPVQEGMQTFHRFLLTLVDRDVDDSLDRFTSISVAWGDGSVDTDTTKRIGDVVESQPMLHVYAGPPQQGNAYKVTVTVSDSHSGGLRDTTFDLNY